MPTKVVEDKFEKHFKKLYCSFFAVTLYTTYLHKYINIHEKRNLKSQRHFLLKISLTESQNKESDSLLSFGTV